MQSFSDIIDAFGGPAPFGKAIKISDSHARTMKARDSIPPEHWSRVVGAAAERSIDGVTFERLTELRSRPRKAETPLSGVCCKPAPPQSTDSGRAVA